MYFFITVLRSRSCLDIALVLSSSSCVLNPLNCIKNRRFGENFDLELRGAFEHFGIPCSMSWAKHLRRLRLIHSDKSPFLMKLELVSFRASYPKVERWNMWFLVSLRTHRSRIGLAISAEVLSLIFLTCFGFLYLPPLPVSLSPKNELFSANAFFLFYSTTKAGN